MKKIIFFIVFVLSASFVYSQNVLWLNNGKKIEIGEFRFSKNETGIDFIQYKSLKRNKSKAIELTDVFSITEKNGNEIIVYSQNTQLGDSFNILEMKSFVQGQTDAKNFKSPSTIIGGVVIGGLSVLTLNPLLAIPLGGGYSSGIGLTKGSKNKIIIPPEYCDNPHYLLGYQKKVKEKRIKNAIIGSLIGLGVGFATFKINRGGLINGRNN